MVERASAGQARRGAGGLTRTLTLTQTQTLTLTLTLALPLTLPLTLTLNLTRWDEPGLQSLQCAWQAHTLTLP